MCPYASISSPPLPLGLHLGRLPRQARVDSGGATRVASSLPTGLRRNHYALPVAVGIYLLQESRDAMAVLLAAPLLPDVVPTSLWS